jgi:hypothetical protein
MVYILFLENITLENEIERARMRKEGLKTERL